METLLAPFQQPFMVDAMTTGALIGAVCAVLSCYLVLKGWALMGDAISHAVLPGIVLAHIAGIPLPLGAFGTGLLCAVSTGFIKTHSRIREDTVMGVVFTGLFAAGLVLFAWVQGNASLQSDLHLDHILYGNILGVTKDLMFNTRVTVVAVLAALLIARRDLLLFCFDPAHARSIGLHTTFLNYLLLTLLALVIVVALQAVGLILVIAMLVTPGCVGHLMSDSFGRMMAVSVSTAVFSSVFGLYLSYHLDASPGASIVLTQSALFLAAFLWAPKHGVLRKQRFAPDAGGAAGGNP